MGKKVRVTLFADNIIYIRDPKDYKNTKADFLKSTFSKETGYKINIQKWVAFLDTNNEHAEKEIRKIIPFTTKYFNKASQVWWYFVCDLTYKTCLKIRVKS